MGDDYRLRSIVTNLIRNSVVHSEGTTITLRIYADETRGADGRIGLSLCVEDDGKGIAQDQITRLFEPFERGDSPSSGAGVGLHLVKNWTEKMGGNVGYSDGLRGGACFCISLRLPIAAKAHQHLINRSDAALSEAKALLQNKRVMLVEDDRILRRATVGLLKREFDIDLIVAEDGAEALRLLEREPVDLILTDYFIPNIDGRELIEALRAQGKQLPIIAITAAVIGYEHDELMAAGANAVLAKPLNPATLASEVCLLANASATETLH